ncbi:MAG: FecCD family ABC transporter permease [Acidimicrobiia bacterium]
MRGAGHPERDGSASVDLSALGGPGSQLRRDVVTGQPSPAALAAARSGAWVARRGRASWRAEPRSIVVTVVAGALAVAGFVVSLAVGDYPIPVAHVVDALLGRPVPGRSGYVVEEIRLPRGLVAMTSGAALALSGGIFQRVARNPLASPDIVGITAGASTAAVAVIVLWAGSSAAVAAGALVGGATTALVIYLAAYRQGVTGYRLILVGIAVGAVLTSVTSYLLVSADLYTVQRASAWLAGGLAGAGWDDVPVLVGATAVLGAAALLLSRQLRLLELDDELAATLGVRVEPARAAVLLVAVALAAIATSVVGPITFVALVAPQIARRLVRERALALVASAAVGGVLVVAADLVARRAFAPTELPAGIVTGVLGAPYLLVLLWRANRVGATG